MLNALKAIRLRRWFRFSLRTFLVAVTLLCLFLGLYVKQRRDQQAAIATIQQWGGVICLEGNFQYVIDEWNSAAGFPARPEQQISQLSSVNVPSSQWNIFSTADHTDPFRDTIFFTREPAWARRLLGDYFFSDVEAVTLRNYATTRLDTRPLTHMPKLRWLDLSNTAVDDEGLQGLRSAKSLEWLQLAHTKVTDDGLHWLQELPRLKVLALERMAVTDRGLETLQALPGLETVFLRDSRATKPGVEKLQAARPGLTVVF